ncbi:LLM class flavin-dependent oxidoreductase [Rhodococcus opacus]|uniref:LLM class flavin-dependent oxidoreductase n=1 Tax=Rhodococcus opacus TaxID=37919 RepID=UPI0024BB3D61|nr:LLM class flavin-dependent oxidoreductase [Rhodococcus opacus]MDJ0413347.1 LLM class flavin-dependent oxidoreductase [Rhodococcus opacus]
MDPRTAHRSTARFRTKILASALTTVALLAAACGGGEEGSGPTSAAGYNLTADQNRITTDEVESIAGKVPQQIRDRGTLIVTGSAGSAPPLRFYADDDKTLIGSETDFAYLIGEVLGLKVDLQTADWAQNFVRIDSGEADAFISNVTVTEERKEKYDFSTYRLDTVALETKKDSGIQIKEPKDVAGLKIAVSSGTNQEALLVKWSEQNVAAGLEPGDSDQGREFGAAQADAIFTIHGSLEDGQKFYTDVNGRLAKYGRSHDDLEVLPAATFVLGDSAADAAERADHIRHQQVGPQTVIALLEQVWGRDLSAYNPDGPLPDVEPADDTNITRGRVRHARDPREIAAAWRAKAEAEKRSIRELIIAVTTRQQFVGTAAQVAEEIDRYVQADACDGFILVPHLTPAGLDEFVEKVVPELQNRGSFRSEYSGTILRSHLGLRHPHHQTEGVRAS